MEKLGASVEEITYEGQPSSVYFGLRSNRKSRKLRRNLSVYAVYSFHYSIAFSFFLHQLIIF